MEKANKPILLILDLDETLIHATTNDVSWQPDHFFSNYKIKKRPHLEPFLLAVRQWYRLAIWSSAGDEYVGEIVEMIRPPEVRFEFVWGRSRCTLTRDYELDEYVREKKVKKLKRKGFALERVLIVDDTAAKLKSNYGNAIYIRPFEGDPEDKELPLLQEYLFSLKDCENVREVEKRNWRKHLSGSG